MTTTWISEAMQAGLRLVGWTNKAASVPPGPTMQEEFSEFKPFAAQVQKLITFQNDSLIPLMEALKLGRHSPAADREHIARFVHSTQDLGRQCTHGALEDIADSMRGIAEKDFTLYETYRALVQLKLSIEEVERTMNVRMRELRHAYPNRPSNRR